MPNRVSYLKARYCRAVLRTARNSPEDDARRLVYALAAETPTAGTSLMIGNAEGLALAALVKMAGRVQERGPASIASHWAETNALLELWIDEADPIAQ